MSVSIKLRMSLLIDCRSFAYLVILIRMLFSGVVMGLKDYGQEVAISEILLQISDSKDMVLKF